ncbi:putative HlyD family secretion protein [Methylocella tundrae]|uniref:Putative HlyD family secretion protein n=1 Tax=Methylocella tundrae TaxID=227605 RepID=A0A8B6M546_METTU|nr:HlyD family efflux transporter periplasmic adaptor subunit [Methylocella tundrae]VTZ26767.1 putative HlyD family secretion protein [Methylocella tundrae]VTZ50131.1 putative HlyD family secretion protein [Methylocella tundrae]
MPARLPGRLLATLFLAAALPLSAPLASFSEEVQLIRPVDAQSAQKSPIERAESALQTLISRLRGRTMPEGIVKSNGRIEATQVDVAAKYPGRLTTLNVDEGDEVTAGQILGTISSPEVEAQLRGAQAQVLGAKQALAAAEALIVQRSSDLAFARTDLERGTNLLDSGNITRQIYDQRRNRFEVAEAAFHAATDQRNQAESQIKSAEADVDRYQAILVDMVLISPRSGRVQYRLARAGEVILPGQRVLTILDLNDVYMTIYLPAADAGRLALGDDARIIADPVPEYVIPATISFVATDAQFTPKSVETDEEREKLMFRVKLQIDPKVLEKYRRQVKTGVRGIGFVRLSPSITWPNDLAVKLPQ